MNINVGDVVKIKKSIDNSCPVESKYIGQEGVVVEINNDRPSPISVNVKGIGVDSFWEEELINK